MKSAYTEGMGRRGVESTSHRLGQEAHAAQDELRTERHLQDIHERVHSVDGPQKALTGRKPEDYAIQSGVPVSELFPEGARILNIGDPWQTLDLEGVVSVDYESGEEASFFFDVEGFFSNFSNHKKGVNDLVEAMRDQTVFNQLSDEFADAYNHLVSVAERCLSLVDTATADSHSQYEKVGDALLDVFAAFGQSVRALEMQYEAQGIDRCVPIDVRAFFYEVQHAARVWRDIGLILTVIEPDLLEDAKRYSGLSAKQKHARIQSIIARERFVPKMRYAEFKKDVFPNLDIEDDSFDRLTASWSLSTHMFEVMKEKDFLLYWNEIDRVLKKNGVAYMWPLFALPYPDFKKSIDAYVRSGGDCAFVNRMTAEVVRYGSEEFTYVVESENTLSMTLVVCARGFHPSRWDDISSAVSAYKKSFADVW